jgi:hypothetical protein
VKRGAEEKADEEEEEEDLPKKKKAKLTKARTSNSPKCVNINDFSDTLSKRNKPRTR